MKKYRIASSGGRTLAEATDDLENLVSAYLEAGWEPHGSVSIALDGPIYLVCQVIVYDVPVP